MNRHVKYKAKFGGAIVLQMLWWMNWIWVRSPLFTEKGVFDWPIRLNLLFWKQSTHVQCPLPWNWWSTSMTTTVFRRRVTKMDTKYTSEIVSWNEASNHLQMGLWYSTGINHFQDNILYDQEHLPQYEMLVLWLCWLIQTFLPKVPIPKKCVNLVL